MLQLIIPFSSYLRCPFVHLIPETEEPLSGNDFEDDSSSAVVTKVPRKKRAPHSQPPQNSSPHNAPAAGGQQVVYASIDPAPSNSYVSSISPHIPPAPGRYPTEIYPADDWNSSMSYRMHESQDDPAIEYHRSNGPRASFDLGSSYNQSNNASTSTGYIDQRPAPRYYESPPMQRSYDMNVNLNLSNSAGSLLDFNPHPPARHYAHDSHPGHLSTFEVPMNLSPSGFEHIAPPTPSPRGIPQHKLRRFGADDSIGRYHAPNMTGTGGAYPYPPGPTLPQLLTTPIQCSTPLYLNHLTVLHTTVT